MTAELTASQAALLCCAESEVRVCVGLLEELPVSSLKLCKLPTHTAPISLLPSFQCIEQVNTAVICLLKTPFLSFIQARCKKIRDPGKFRQPRPRPRTKFQPGKHTYFAALHRNAWNETTLLLSLAPLRSLLPLVHRIAPSDFLPTAVGGKMFSVRHLQTEHKAARMYRLLAKHERARQQ